jgi:choline dehydrogenase-like flavoprotein
MATALHLARRGRRVLLLEAGPREPPVDWQDHNEGRNIGRDHQGLKAGRLQALGGTTRLWGGQLVPFDRMDFEPDELVGKPGWPVAYDEFTQWLEVAYEFLSVEKQARNTAALWTKATRLHQPFGEDIVIGMNVWLPQPDFTKLFGLELNGLKNLVVLTDAPVHSLRFSERKLAGVVVRCSDGRYREFNGSFVVLANGTFEISRLLLSTAATDPKCGFADNKHIGRWFVDHIHGLCGRISGSKISNIGEIFDNIYFRHRKYNVKMRIGGMLRARHGLANVAATINAPTGLRLMLNDLATFLRRLLKGDSAGVAPALSQSIGLGRILLPIAWRYLVKRRSTIIGREVWLGLELEQVPSERSFLALDPNFPPAESPIVLHWDYGEVEMRTAQKMAQVVAAQFSRAGYGTVELDPDLLAGDAAWFDRCHDSYHQMGGARMAASSDQGVVDADCRVFGTENLYLAGAAVFPSGSFANPTLTAIALALRLADHLDARFEQTAPP